MEAEMSADKDSDVDLSQGSAESFRCLGSADQMDTLSTSGMRDSSMTKDLS